MNIQNTGKPEYEDFFAAEDAVSDDEQSKVKWKVLIVDDEEDVHEVTRMALADFSFDGRNLEFISAFTGKEAETLASKNRDIALMFVDVVMEAEDAGLQFIKYARDTLKNSSVRIILRTGQPGSAPEKDVIKNYDINDYKVKEELTAQKLYTSVFSSLRALKNIINLNAILNNLEKLVEQRTSELNEQNKELVKLNALKNSFVGMAAHDLRNPLTVICSLTQLMMMDMAALSPDKIEKNLGMIRVSGQRMLALINNLLDVTAIESGNLKLNIQSGSLKKLIEERLQLFEFNAKKKDIEIQLTLNNACDGFFDQNHIAQVIDNLVSNALKFSEPNKNIYITLELENTKAKVSVRDEGPGISKEDQVKLYGTFQKLSAQPTAGEKSTGLGLAIVKKVIEAHKGELKVDSQLGAGTTFSFTLPLNLD